MKPMLVVGKSHDPDKDDTFSSRDKDHKWFSYNQDKQNDLL